MKTVIEMAREAGFEQTGHASYAEFTARLERFHTLTRNATLDEIATKIEAMPFGDTAASFAVWIKEQKT